MVAGHTGSAPPLEPVFVQRYALSFDFVGTTTVAGIAFHAPTGEPASPPSISFQLRASYPSFVTTWSRNSPGAASAASLHRRSPTRRNDPRTKDSRLYLGDANQTNGGSPEAFPKIK